MRVASRLNSEIRPTTRVRLQNGIYFMTQIFSVAPFKDDHRPLLRMTPHKNFVHTLVGYNHGESGVFSHHGFPPEPFQKTSTGEGTLHCLVIWKSPHPHLLPVYEQSHCGPNTVLILLLRGGVGGGAKR